MKRIPLNMLCACLIFSIAVLNIAFADDPINSSMDYTMFRLASEQKDPSAQYLVGKKYLMGKTVDKDVNKAIKWFTMAAEQNHKKAQFILGKMYLDGKQVPTNYIYAQQFLSQAAENNHLEAQFELANFLSQGIGGIRNTDQAIKWYRRAADRQHSGALYRLGKILYEGDGVAADKNEAITLLKLAVETGHGKAIKYYTQISHNRRNSQKQMLPTQAKSSTNKNKADHKNTKSSPADDAKNQNSPPIQQETADHQFEMGLAYLYGDGIDKDFTKALNWLKKAANREYLEAQYQLGVLYRDGIGVPQNNTQALKWFKMAMSKGYKDAQTEFDEITLDNFYQQSIDQDIDTDAASAEANYKLGMMYFEGKGIGKDPEQSLKWIIAAAENNHHAAQYQLSIMYSEGIGIEKNKKQAKHWSNMAAKGGIEKTKIATKPPTINAHTEQDSLLSTSTSEPQKTRSHNVTDNHITDRNGSNTYNDRDAEYEDKNTDNYQSATRNQANNGDVQAQYTLGASYFHGGKSTKSDAEIGVQWLEKAAIENHLAAQRKLAEIYKNGEGIAQNILLARKWFGIAADNGDAQSQFELGLMYQQGVGVKKNNAQALKWFRKAAKQGHEDARKKFGNCRIC